MCEHILDKNVWTQDDFELMNWRDARIYGIIIEKGETPWDTDILFDIDYILQRIEPVFPDKKPAFWVAPCTLIFRGAFDFRCNTNAHGGFLDLLEIENLHLTNAEEREENGGVYEWHIKLLHGNMCLKSNGFNLIVRKHPSLIQMPVLDIECRGGISFGKETYQG